MADLVRADSRGGSKILELESVRGIAAMFVVLYHIPGYWQDIFNVVFIRNGYLMVPLFFVLSGFVINGAYGDKIDTRGQLFKFQFLRFGRLYPVHLLFLVIFLAIEFAKYVALTKAGIHAPNADANGAPFSKNNFTAFVENLLLVQAIGPTGNGSTFNGVSWSISVEFYTYLVFAAIILYARSVKVFVFCAIAAAANALLLMKAITGFDTGFTDLLDCFAGFFVGCITSWLQQVLRVRLPAIFAAISFGLIVLFLSIKTDPVYDGAIYFLTAVLIFSIVSSSGGLFKSMLRSSALGWLGTISYSIYMSHPAILWSMNQFYRVVLKMPEIQVGNFMTPQMPPIAAVASYLVSVGIVIAVSSAIYLWLEKPMRKKSRSLVGC